MAEMWLEKVARAVADGHQTSSPAPLVNEVLTGYSGAKVVGALRSLAVLFEDDPTACYLEIGVFQGLTLLSVSSTARRLPCFGVDNFAYFDPEHRNRSIVEDRREQLGIANAHLIDADYEDALGSLDQYLGGRKIGVYFIDGPHDYRSQLMCLQLALPHLHDRCVIVIDDSNYRHVRLANRDFLATHPDFRLLFEAYTDRHPGNMDEAAHRSARDGWWDGINVIVRDPESVLEPMFPPTFRSRELYEQEHILHSRAAPEHALVAMDVLEALDRHAPVRLARSLARAVRHLRRTRSDRRGRFPSMNTYSDELPTTRLNPSAMEHTE